MEINNLEKFKSKMLSGKTCIGTVITLTDPSVSELAGDVGFDFTWIDGEHSPNNITSIMGHIMALRGTDCAPLVRVPWNEQGVIKPILDLAPAGVIIPMVNSADEAEAAVAACRYPSRGRRSCSPRRGWKYGAYNLFDYLKASQNDPMVIVQIEHIDAVKNLDEILRVPGVDSICIGPYDLSGSMGIMHQMDNPEINRILEEICVKTLKAGVLLGMAATSYFPWEKHGVNWVAMTSDWGAMVAHYSNVLESCRKKITGA